MNESNGDMPYPAMTGYLQTKLALYGEFDKWMGTAKAEGLPFNYVVAVVLDSTSMLRDYPNTFNYFLSKYRKEHADDCEC
jgi:hypothetical protein